MALRIPREACWGREGAAAIAGDPARVRAAAAYWRQAIGTLDDDGSNSEALEFAFAVEHGLLSWLVPGSAARIAGCVQEGNVTSHSGCLVSMQDLASAVRSMSKPEDVIPALRAFLAVADGVAIPIGDAITGLRAAREVRDLVLRHRICRWNSSEFGPDLPALLALYRQEGALCIAPSAASFPHAPLISTAKRACRTSDLSVLGFDPSGERPGFNLVYRFREALDSSTATESVRFDVALRNILGVGGLDTVMLPNLPKHDERGLIFERARAAKHEAVKGLHEDFGRWMARTPIRPVNVAAQVTQQKLFDLWCLGLFRSRSDAMDGPIDLDALLHDVYLTVGTTLAAHDHHPARPWPGRDVWLCDDDTASATSAALREQAMWFATRARIDTLLAWRDRRPALPGAHARGFSPFLTYLRYNTGDAIFVGILLRVLTGLEQLRRRWNANSKTWGDDFPRALAAMVAPTGAIDSIRQELDGFWRSPRVPKHAEWHGIGLVERASELTNPPAWVGTVPKPNADLDRCARIARMLVDILAAPGVLATVECALERTPVHWLSYDKLLATTDERGREPLVKSHSFERMRVIYAKAWAGL